MKKRKTIESAVEASSVHIDKESNDDAHDHYFNENDSDDSYFNNEENNDDSYHYFNDNDSTDNNYSYLNDDINNLQIRLPETGNNIGRNYQNWPPR